MTARRQPPQDGPIRREESIEDRAVDAFLQYSRPEAVADITGTLPAVGRLQQGPSASDLRQHGLVPLVGIGDGERIVRQKTFEIAEVRPRLAGGGLDPVHVDGLERVEEREVGLARWGDGEPPAFLVRPDAHVLREHVPLHRRQRVLRGPSAPDPGEGLRRRFEQFHARGGAVHPRGPILESQKGGF
jgi:hypothetical protein